MGGERQENRREEGGIGKKEQAREEKRERCSDGG